MDILTQIFESDPFSVMGLTNSIVTMPYVSTQFSSETSWTETACYEDSFAIDLEQHQIYLLGTVARGESLPTAMRSDRQMVKFNIPRLGESFSVTLDEVRGRRSTGTMSKTSIEELATQKNTLVKARISHTIDYGRRQAYDGRVIDPITGKVLVDVLRTFNKQQLVQNMDFTDSTLDLVSILGDLKRQVEDSLGDSTVTITGWKMLCGRGVFRASKQLPLLREAWTDYSAVGAKISRFLTADRNVPGGFEICDDVTLIDAGRARMPVYDAQGNYLGKTGFLADNEFRLIPIIEDFYHTAWGPSSRMIFDGVVLPQYAFPMPRKDNTGFDVEIDGFPLHYVDRPDCIVRGKVKLPPSMVNPVDVPLTNANAGGTGGAPNASSNTGGAGA